MFKAKRSQKDIFNSYGWWDKDSLLYAITQDRCNYIESCVNKVFGAEALAQQDILEIGSGGGLICEDLARRSANMVGIDPSQGALQVARQHALQSGLGYRIYYEQGHSESLPYADGSFSVIVCLDVLEHVQDLKATISEIARVLAPGGVFVFDTINRTLLARIALIWFGERFLSSNGGLTPGLHDYHSFIKPIELLTVLSNAHLQVHELAGFMPKGFARGRVKMGPGWFMGVSYVGYVTKGRKNRTPLGGVSLKRHA